jgi:hypothetical protein
VKDPVVDLQMGNDIQQLGEVVVTAAGSKGKRNHWVTGWRMYLVQSFSKFLKQIHCVRCKAK